jgi:uncharacterized membrane protein (DUF4010 family)
MDVAGSALELQQVLWHLLTATLIGFVVGLERERAKAERIIGVLGGVRTFTLLGLLGALCAVAPLNYLSAVGLVVIGALALVSHRQHEGSTTEVAALAVYVLGALCGFGLVIPALFGGVIVFVFLGFREELHTFVAGLKREELEAALLLALFLGVIYPLLPDASYGPYGIWNPREIWRVVLLVAGVNFVGYIALRLLGSRGLWLAALLGGLVSSTAVTLSMTSQARHQPDKAMLWAGGVILASEMMLVRILVWSGLNNAGLLERLWLPVGVWLLWGAGVAWWFSRRDNTPAEAVSVGNPLQLRSALMFALVYAAIKLLTQLGLILLGDAGVYAVSAVSGVADVDAISLSLSRLAATGELSTHVAAFAILFATLSNTLFKSILTLGAKSLGRYVFIGLLPGGLFALAVFTIFFSR